MEKEIHKQTRMIAAVTEALSFKRKNFTSDNQVILKHIAKFVSVEADELTKIGMIASASKALEISERNPAMKEREIIKQVVNELDGIIQQIDY